MLVFAYDGSLNGDWVAHYAARFAANTRERRLRLVHVHDGSPPPHLPERIGRIAEECRLLGVALEPELHARGGARVAERLIDLVPLGHETTLICGARAHMRNLAFLAGTVSARLLGAGRFRVVALRVVDPLYRAATGVTLVSVVFAQVANLVGRRYEERSGLDRGLLRNPLLLIGVALELAFAFAVLYWAPVGAVLATGSVAPWLVALAALGAPILFLADLARKRLARPVARGGPLPRKMRT